MLAKTLVTAVATAAALTMATAAQAATITFGFTFTVSDEYVGPAGVGTHFHSNTGGSFGNPAGLAEVGEYYDETVKGLSEYDLTGLSTTPSAYVTFNVYSLQGLFGQGSLLDTIEVVAYEGNSTEDHADYEEAAIGSVGSFATAGLVQGHMISLDITSIFNDAIANGLTSLGIRLQNVSGNNNTMRLAATVGDAITFNNFRLTTEDLTGAPVPEPATLTLLAIGGAGAGVRRLMRRRRA